MLSKHNKNFNAVSVHAPKARPPQNDMQWGWWLAGLIDSDGHMNKLGYLVLVFDTANVSSAYAVKTKIGYGRVAPSKNKAAYTYVLSQMPGRLWVASVIRNKLQTANKIYQFNTRFAPALNLSPTQQVQSDLNCNHWMAGFVQGDGSFQIKRRQVLKLPEVRCVLQIDQAHPDVLKRIQKFFGGSIGYRQSQNTYYYSSVSFKNAVALIHYLDTYQVSGGRLTAYWLWRRSYVLVQQGQHLNLLGLNKIARIKAKLNKSQAAPPGAPEAHSICKILNKIESNPC